MFELYQINQDLYQIHGSDPHMKAMEGSLLAIGTYMVHSLDFKAEELELALLTMLEHNLDSSHFGINRMFIYAFNKNEGRKTG